MRLSQNQVNEILSILDRQIAFFIGNSLGESFLTEDQKKVLTKSGVNIKTLYNRSNDVVEMNFHLGMLSDILSRETIKKMTFEQLKRYVNSGQHIPLNERERQSIESVKRQSLADIKATQGKIFQDINRVVNDAGNRHRSQHEFLREKVIEGLSRRESAKKISTDLAKLTGDWTRNFTKSVSYISHTALNEGRLAILQRRYQDPNNAKVYFIVQDTACEHCVKAYLTAGKGSTPKIFTVRELLQNGSNIGRKTSEYKPSIEPLHLNCRCLLTEYVEKQPEIQIKTDKKPVKRSKVRIEFGGKEYFV